jgi:histidine phosphotransferase ChpT
MPHQLPVPVLELLLSHVCHDLISPVGAINNGLELYEQFGGSNSDGVAEAMDFIGDSAVKASRILQCYRLAYGAAGRRQGIGLGETREVALPYFDEQRGELQWPESFEYDGELPDGYAKTLLCAVILAGSAIKRDGIIRVSMDDSDRPTAVIQVTGDKIGFREHTETALALTVDTDDLTPHTVHAWVTGEFARAFDLNISIDQPGESDIRLVLTPAS